jgi:hypothetical protein
MSSHAKRPAPQISSDLHPLLQRLARLRVLRSSQAHGLFEPFASHSDRNARKHLRKLVETGYLRAALIEPGKGPFSAFYYQLASRGLAVIGREKDRYLLARPPQHVLRFLLFRNDIYAAARNAGFHVGSPILTPIPDQPSYLDLFRQWAVDSKRRHLSSLEAARAPQVDLIRARQDLERLPRFLPQQLKFEFLVRVDGVRAPSEMILLVIDNPTRRIDRAPASRRPRRTAQIQDLPTVVLPGLRLCLRDAQSRYDLIKHELFLTSGRLRKWRRLLAAKYGEDFLATDTLFPDLWANRIAVPEAVHAQHATGG